MAKVKTQLIDERDDFYNDQGEVFFPRAELVRKPQKDAPDIHCLYLLREDSNGNASEPELILTIRQEACIEYETDGSEKVINISCKHQFRISIAGSEFRGRLSCHPEILQGYVDADKYPTLQSAQIFATSIGNEILDSITH